jgi:predicted dehydrogenase
MSTQPELRVGIIGYGVMGKAHCYAPKKGGSPSAK